MTRAGRGLLVVGVVLYALSWSVGSPELVVFAVAAGLLLVVAVAFVLRRPSLRVDRRVTPGRVTVDELAEGFVTVTNTGRRPSGGLVCQDRVGAAVAEVVVPRLSAGRAVTVPYALPTGHRGVIDVGPLEVVYADPMGLVERRVPFGSAAVLYVHPRVHAVPGPRIGLRVDLDAETSSATRGDATFHALREYVRGDDLRRVHWKATAHVGELMVREQVDPIRPDTTLVLDARRSVLDPEGFELAVEVVASLAVAALERGFPIALSGTSASLRAGVPTDQRGRVLDLLAGVEQHDEAGDLDLVLGHVLRASSGRALVVVTGSASEDDLARLASGGRRFQEVVVVVVDPHPVPGAAPIAPPGRVEVLQVRDAAGFVAAWGRR